MDDAIMFSESNSVRLILDTQRSDQFRACPQALIVSTLFSFTKYDGPSTGIFFGLQKSYVPQTLIVPRTLWPLSSTVLPSKILLPHKNDRGCLCNNCSGRCVRCRQDIAQGGVFCVLLCAWEHQRDPSSLACESQWDQSETYLCNAWI